MSALQLRVGASMDRSVATVFEQMKQLGQRANRAIADEAAKAAKAEEKSWKDAERELARMRSDQQREASKAAKAQERAAKDAAREETRAWKEAERDLSRMRAESVNEYKRHARERAAADREAARESERAANDAARAWVRKREKQQREMKALAQGAIQMGVGAATSAGRFGLSVLGDMAQGAGARLDMASHFAAASQMQNNAVQLSNAGYMPSTGGPNGMRQDPNELMSDAYRVGNATGTAANDVLGGMSQFVGKTGDLQSARDTIESLAKLSKATGANLMDMSDAAADVSNQLGDIPDKGARIKDVMMAIAGQGKLGAVEIKDLASQMAKVASAAQMMQGDAGDNIKLLGAIAQESRGHGGSASASQAATSVQSMMAVFSKSARLDAFHNLGVKTSDQTSGKLRKIDDIIVDTLVATQKKGGHNVDTVNKLFGSTFATSQARRAVGGFESIFRSTYATSNGSEQDKLAAATKAVREEFDRLKRVQMSEEELRESFAASMETGQSKAEEWNNTMQQLAADTQKELFPALIGLAPALINATKAIASIAVDIWGVKKAPSEDLDKANASTHKDVRNIAGMLQQPDRMTPEDFDTAEKLLKKRKETLAGKRQSAETEVASLKAQQKSQGDGGGVGDWLQETAGQASEGNWGSALMTLVAPTDSSKWQSVQARKGNISSAEESLKETKAEEREVDDQLQALRDTHDFLRHGNDLLDTIAKNTTPKKTGPTAGGPGSKGLEPTE